MSASKVLDLAEKQGLLEPKVIADLRKQVADSKFVVTPEALAKVLVDHGHLTSFQARKLVNTALDPPAALPKPPPLPPEPPPAPKPAPKPPAKPVRNIPDELTLADDLGLAEAARPAAAPPPVEEDVVMMEAVEPAPQPVSRSAARPATSKPAGPRGEPKPAPPQAKSAPQPGKPPAKPPVEDLVELEPMPAAPKPAGSWKSPPPPAPAAPTKDLTPIKPAALAAVAPSPAAAPAPAPATALVPLDDLFADPLAQPADPLANAALMGPPAVKKKERRNVWDSPLLLVGGGGLGVMIVAVGLLYYSLTRGSAAELFAKAEEEYKGGAYTNAMALYDAFLQSYPGNPNVSLAKVRRGMAQLHQVTDQGQNPKQGLQTAQSVLPVIDKEEKFGDARQELATILPEIADGFATLAAQAKETAQKEELLKQADEAMKLVNNPLYLPASLKKERESKINAVLDKLKVAQRSIEQDKDLAAALEKIAAAETAGDAAQAYQTRADLLKIYPGLEANPELQAAIRKVGDKERELVTTSDEPMPAATDDPLAGGTRLVLTARQGPEPAAAPARFAFVLVEGAVYGIDSASGRALWRRHVGYETFVPPQPIAHEGAADALVADGRKHELLRLAAATGKVVWRQPIGQPFFAPTIAGERIYVTTQAGRILAIDAADGGVRNSVQLPQTATSPAAFDARQARLIQLGRHSTLFVLNGSTLACSETYYLGHLAGAILVPPVTVLDHVFAVESPADDYTLIRILAPGGESKRLAEVGRVMRLKGRVVMPLVVTGRRVAVMTDLGQIAVYEVDPANKQLPVRLVAGLEATERVPALGFYTADASRLWVAGRRCSMFEIQPALQNLSRKWSLHQDDAFIAPLEFLGGVLVHVRRQPGSAAVVVAGCQPETGATIWETQLASPLAGLLPASARKTVDAVTQQGLIFPISSEQLRSGINDAPAFPLPQGSAGLIWPELAVSADGATAVWTETQPGGRVFSYDVTAGTAPAVISLPDGKDAAATAGALWGKNVAVPLRTGKMTLLDVAAGKQAVLPFLPPLNPDELSRWTRPAVLPDGSGLVIGDGRHTLYRVVRKDQPQPHLEASSEQALELELQGSLVAAGDSVYGVARGEAGETVVAIDPKSLAVGAKWPLTGRTQFGLEAVAGLAFAATEADGLLCLVGGQKLRWKQPLAHGPLAGPPIALPSGELLLLYQGGFVSRIAVDTGNEVAARDVGEPLGRAACLVGQQLFVSTSDGGVVLVPLPQ